MSEQVRRIVHIMKKLDSGHRMSSKEIIEDIPDDLQGVSLRTIQRDISLMMECMPELLCTSKGKERYYEYDRKLRKPRNVPSINSNELLSYHILKAHLKTFEHTVIEEEVKNLTNKLEKIAPSDAFSSESFYWDQNIGQYDYTNFDPIIRRILHCIEKEIWVDVEYFSHYKNEMIKCTVLFQKLFTYYGMLYVVSYVPKHDHHIALAVQNFENIEINRRFTSEIPEFSFRDWTKTRFGVFEGEPKEIEIQIPKEVARYFQNRHWHQSQTFSYDKDENLILSLKVPITPDFVSWVLSWSDLIIVRKPNELKKILKRKFRDALCYYIEM